MSKRFLDADWTTFALYAVLALTLIAFIAVPTRRVSVHRAALHDASPGTASQPNPNPRP